MSSLRTRLHRVAKAGVDLAIATPVIGEPVYDACVVRNIRRGTFDDLTTPSELRRVFNPIVKELVEAHGPRLTYFEAGVFAGQSHAVWHEVAAEHGVECRSHGADSFQGLPESVTGDEGGWIPGSFRCSQRVAEWNLRRMGAPMDRITLVKGWYDESLTPELGRQVGPVHVAMLDADAYSSTVPVLRFLGPLLTDPSYIVFDDWWDDNGDPSLGVSLGRGVERAFNEWLADNPAWTPTHTGDYDLIGPDTRGIYGHVVRLDRSGPAPG
ncbi:MAG: TylF/MycF/NovP-related O-methyltransferase [Acidimicrobiales bacterium]